MFAYATATMPVNPRGDMSDRRGGDHWRRLKQSLGVDAQDIHGYGYVTVKIIFVDWLPMQIDTLERVCTRRLDRDQAVVTVDGTGPRA